MIYYNEEKDGWFLDQITEREKEQLLALGTEELMSLLGAAIIRQGQMQETLDAIPVEEMSQA